MSGGRRTSLASLAGGKVETVPGQSEPLLLTLPLEKLAPCRFNSRQNFGTEEQLRDFGAKLAKKQLQPAVVVTRASFLKLWPEEADTVGTKPYVIVNGERRYRASVLVGRHLEVVVRDDLAESRAVFLDSIMSENEDRADLDPIERALGIQTMVDQLGGAVHVAKYYGKSEGWVSQQRKLLKLTKPLQEAVSAGELAPRLGRELAGLKPEMQEQAWADELDRRARAKEESAATRAAKASEQPPQPPAQPAPVFTAVKNEPPAPEASTGKPSPAATIRPAVKPESPEQPQTAGEGGLREAENMPPVPEPRTGSARPATPRQNDQPDGDGADQAAPPQEPHHGDPWETLPSLVQHIVGRLPAHAVVELTKLLQQHNRSVATSHRM